MEQPLLSVQGGWAEFEGLRAGLVETGAAAGASPASSAGGDLRGSGIELDAGPTRLSG
jgi:hypothetical protein